MKIILTVLACVAILGCGGYSNNSSSGSMAAGTPAIQELVPDNIKAGSAGFTLTVNGSHFANGAVVYWNGSARTTMFALPGQITAAISAADIANPGTASVMVKNPGGTGIYMNQPGPQSNTLTFTVEP
jgi:hypothetical protein